MLPAIAPLFMMIMMSGSVGSFVIVIIGISLSFITVIKKKPSVAILVIVCLCMLFYYLLSNFDTDSFSLYDRYITKVENGEEDIRTQLLKASWNVFCDYPILGCGQVDYISEMMKYGQDHYAHNVYMHVLTINGILGIIPFLLFTYKLFRGALGVVRKNGFAFVLFCFMALIASKTGGALTYLFMWYVFGLIAALVNNVRENSVEYVK